MSTGEENTDSYIDKYSSDSDDNSTIDQSEEDENVGSDDETKSIDLSGPEITASDIDSIIISTSANAIKDLAPMGPWSLATRASRNLIGNFYIGKDQSWKDMTIVTHTPMYIIIPKSKRDTFAKEYGICTERYMRSSVDTGHIAEASLTHKLLVTEDLLKVLHNSGVEKVILVAHGLRAKPDANWQLYTKLFADYPETRLEVDVALRVHTEGDNMCIPLVRFKEGSFPQKRKVVYNCLRSHRKNDIKNPFGSIEVPTGYGGVKNGCRKIKGYGLYLHVFRNTVFANLEDEKKLKRNLQRFEKYMERVMNTLEEPRVKNYLPGLRLELRVQCQSIPEAIDKAIHVGREIYPKLEVLYIPVDDYLKHSRFWLETYRTNQYFYKNGPKHMNKILQFVLLNEFGITNYKISKTIVKLHVDTYKMKPTPSTRSTGQSTSDVEPPLRYQWEIDHNEDLLCQTDNESGDGFCQELVSLENSETLNENFSCKCGSSDLYCSKCSKKSFKEIGSGERKMINYLKMYWKSFFRPHQNSTIVQAQKFLRLFSRYDEKRYQKGMRLYVKRKGNEYIGRKMFFLSTNPMEIIEKTVKQYPDTWQDLFFCRKEPLTIQMANNRKQPLLPERYRSEPIKTNRLHNSMHFKCVGRLTKHMIMDSLTFNSEKTRRERIFPERTRNTNNPENYYKNPSKSRDINLLFLSNEKDHYTPSLYSKNNERIQRIHRHKPRIMFGPKKGQFASKKNQHRGGRGRFVKKIVKSQVTAASKDILSNTLTTLVNSRVISPQRRGNDVQQSRPVNDVPLQLIAVDQRVTLGARVIAKHAKKTALKGSDGQLTHQKSRKHRKVDISTDGLLRQLGFKRHEIVADGNCLFRTFAHQLYDDQRRHKEIRDKCVIHVLELKEQFVQLLNSDESQDFKTKGQEISEISEEFVDCLNTYDNPDLTKKVRGISTDKLLFHYTSMYMNCDKIWGGNLELVAMTRVYQCEIMLYFESNGRLVKQQLIDNPSKVHKTYHMWFSPTRNHYESLKLIKKVEARGAERSFFASS